jgi:tRNA threonylcarbamoyladenosine biosynthesis protein TsaB
MSLISPSVLALDTATEACSVALLLGGEMRAEYVELERGHAERILPMIDAQLHAAGVALGQLDAIAFGRGPGAFTGVRLAAGVAQGLAYGAGLRVVPVSDLAAVAARVMREHGAEHVVVCNDARMGQVYWATFVADADGLPQLHSAEAVGDPDAVRAEGRGWHGAGSGFRAYPSLHTRLRAQLARYDESYLPRAQEVALIGAAAVTRGQTVAPEDALPVYIRDNVADPTAAVMKLS